MMVNIQDRQAFLDISVILKMMPNSMIEKIDHRFINYIEENKDVEYVSKINPKVPLKEQNVNENTKMILALIYREFLCSEEERKKFQENDKKEYEEARRKIEEKIKEKYNQDDIFKKTNINVQYENNTAKEERVTIVHKEKWYQKLLNVLKNIFKNNN